MVELLNVRNLSVDYFNKSKKTSILKDVSFSVKEGECLGILGESGSGKSKTEK